MNFNNDVKPLKPEELVSKSDSELLQLKRFFELKLEESKKYDIFRKPKEWVINNRNVTIVIFLIGIIVMVVSFYLGVKMNSIVYSVPSMIVMAGFMFFAMMFEDKKSDIYRRNYKMLDLLIKVRIENSNQKQNMPTIGKKAMAVYNTLKELGDTNLTVLRKKLKEKGVNLTDKTLRKYLNEELKDVIAYKNTSFESISRHQKQAKVYYIKS